MKSFGVISLIGLAVCPLPSVAAPAAKPAHPPRAAKTYASLIDAVKANDIAAVTRKLRQGANVNEPDGDGLAPLDFATGSAMKALLRSHGGSYGIASPHSSEETVAGQKPLSLPEAVSTGDLDQVRAALKPGVDIDQQDAHGATPLMAAILEKKPDIVDFLLMKGASVSSEDYGGLTALDFTKYDPDQGPVMQRMAAAIVKAGGKPGDGHQAMFSPDHTLFARVSSYAPDPDDADAWVLEGDATNLSGKTLDYAEINANFDSEGSVVDSGLANIQNLGPHESWHFKMTTLAKDAYGYKLTKLISR